MLIFLASPTESFQFPHLDDLMQKLGGPTKEDVVTHAHHKHRLRRSRPSIADRSNKLYEIETEESVESKIILF